jgi:hypothetical protein
VTTIGSRLRTQATARFGGSKWYWRLRRLGYLVRFRVDRVGLRVVGQGGTVSEGVSAGREVVRGAGPAVVGAVVIFVGLWALERWRLDVLDVLRLDRGWFARAARRPTSGSAYDTGLQALAGVGGVFLALYFTAISTVAANVYAAVPHDIRNLMLRDKVGNAYVRVVALLTALSGLLLLARAAGASVWHVALPVLAVLTLFSVYAFVRLGQRAFYFFDPTILATRVEADFRSWFRRARANGYRADDQAFQSHYRSRARAAAESFTALVRITGRQETVDVAPLDRLAASIIRTLRFHARHKHEIPAQSLWFGQRPRHRQWFLTGATELMIAGPTFTSLQPEVVPDRDWVEESLLGSLVDALRTHLRSGRLLAAAMLLAAITDAIEDISRSGAPQLALTWSEAIASAAIDAVLTAPADDPTEQRAIVAVLDTAMMLPLAIDIGMLKATTSFDVDSFDAELTSPTAICRVAHGRQLPPRVKDYLELVASTLDFEKISNAPVRTAQWFVVEWGLNHLALAMESDLRRLLAWSADFAERVADQAVAAERFVEAAALSSRGLELAGRLGVLLDSSEQLAAEIETRARLGDDLPRPRWEWTQWREATEALQVDMIERLASTIPQLALRDPREDIPDYLGEAVHRAGEACFDALAANRTVVFQRLYRPYFFGALTVSDRLRQQLADRHPVAAVPWLAEPIVDLLSISGYALVFAELHANPALWNGVRALWDEFLGRPEGAAAAPVIAASIAYRESRLGLGPRDMLRTWDGRTGAIIGQLPRAAPRHEFGAGEVQHASALIRSLGGSYLGGVPRMRGLDVFVARYVMNQPTTARLDFGIPEWRTRDLRRLPQLGSEQ